MQAGTIPKSLEKLEIQVSGKIVSQISRFGSLSRFDFDVESFHIEDEALPNPGRIQLTSYERELTFEPEDRWKFRVRLKQPRSLVNPGMGFDYASWLMSKGVTANGYIVNGSAKQIIGLDTHFSIHFDPIQTARKGFADFLATQPISKSHRAVFGALSVGIREEMDDRTWRVLRNTGTAHLVAISGLHIGLVALIFGVIGGAIWQLSSRFLGRIIKQDFKWCFALSAAIIYALLAGLTLPTQRAVSMLLIAALVTFLRRNVPPWWLLSLTVTVVLIINPLAPLANSFWLSFVAVTILICGLDLEHKSKDEIITKGGASWRHLLALIKKWGKVQSWLFVAMMPVFAIGFHQISIVAPVANLIAVPIVGMTIVPLVLLALIGWCLGLFEFAALIVKLTSFLFQYVWNYLAWLGSFQWATDKLGAPGQAAIWLACLGFVLLVLGRKLPYRSLGAIWFLPLFVSGTPALSEGEFRYSLLDAGQGLASVVQTRNHVMVFDAGASYSSGFDIGEAVVGPFIRSQDYTHIDLLLISHGDNDHAGGAKSLDREFDVRHLMASDPSSELIPPSAEHCEEGQIWQWDEVTFEVIWPYSGVDRRGNNGSCVIKVSSRFGSLLLTGDIERFAEHQLVRLSRGKLSADVLQVPHHGSNTSSTQFFIRSVDPAIALVGNGYLNRFGHPATQIKERYRRAGVPMLSAADHGAIQVDFSSSGIRLQGERAQIPRFWRDRPPSDELIYLTKPIAKTRGDILPAG